MWELKTKSWIWSLPVSLLLIGAAPPALAQADGEADHGLAVVRMELLDSPNGFAIPDDSVFYPGEQVFLAFNIAGYTIDDDYQMKVSYRITTESPLGKAFTMAEGGEWDHEVAVEDEGWEPLVKYTAVVPQYAGSGLYRITAEVTDHIAEKTVRKTFPVRVDGADVETSDSLTVRNFEFALSEGGTPLPDPVVRAGDQLWASFYITGYLTGSDNAYDVESEMRILDPEGKTVLAFDPRGEKGAPFYPRLWLPGSFRLDLDRSAATGTYTVILDVRDKVGEKTLQAEERFQVR